MLRRIIMAGLCAGAIGVIVTGPGGAVATHEPADKVAATASNIDALDDNVVLLQETMRVSSTSDLILQTTAECSILTALRNPGSDQPGTNDTQGSFGQVELWITIDGKRVPVSTATANDNDPSTDDGDDGEVVFCNRAYARQIADTENAPDGYDEEDDFIRTRTANAFNWMAFNVGKEYDAGANNLVTIQLHGRFTRENSNANESCGAPQPDNALIPYNMTCSDAFVGSRSLIAEAVHASNHEAAAPVDDGAEDTGGSGLSLLP